MHLYPINSAVHRVDAEATAFAHRNSMWAEVIVGVDPDPNTFEQAKGWAQRYWEATRPDDSAGRTDLSDGRRPLATMRATGV
jgi:hypothetical protein